MGKFRTNTVAAGTDIDESCCNEASAIRGMGFRGMAVTAKRPGQKRQACRGGKAPITRPEPGKVFAKSSYIPSLPSVGPRKPLRIKLAPLVKSRRKGAGLAKVLADKAA